MSTVAVTGSASGIGAATATRLRDAGHRVIGVDLRSADVPADLAATEGRTAAVEGVLDRCDGVLDGLVACAGLGPHVDDVARIAQVNYFGTVAVIDGLFPALRKGTAAAAVVVSSVASTHLKWEENPLTEAIETGDESLIAEAVAAGGDYRGQFAYAAGKNALTVAVRRRAAEWGAAGVRLNTVAPGSVDTPLLAATAEDPRYGEAIRGFTAPIPRHGRPDEIAALACYLLGPDAGFVHGAQFVVDGGIDALLRPTVF
ncbi:MULTISPECIES: SDR family oxidoreductase [Amycolatopsis]|uniref:SDR family oxidoreductase n=2 Tax=Amycolatopsis TaxID=1813 RepID=A0A8E1W831_9PSEU|nr:MULTISPECIES: SDR family oxidoreductase [Amycolatopsis]MBB2505900.1 SDR family oxidoreductase [Amycolatopsis echigonensis]WIY01224.1 SDR family oxidoreductase [Amycolatopsis sp. 4-36]